MITPENKIIYEFWKDTVLKDAVHEYLVSYLKDEAIRRLFNKNDMDESTVYGFPEASLVIEGAFTNLDELFEPKPKTTGTNSPR